jgi:hypothetical protein
MINRIKKLETIKEKIINNQYSNHLEIAMDIENLIEFFWFKDRPLRNDDLFDVDLNELSTFHNHLICEVKKIHLSEIDTQNENILKENTNAKFCVENAIDSKSGYKIYCFNKKRDYIFIGDLHSDDYSLKRILKDVDFFENIMNEEKQILIFNGDYVDRGNSHLKILERLLIIKYLFPKRIFLLRGNHDGGKINEDGSIELPYRVLTEDEDDSYFPLYVRSLSLKNETMNPDLLKNYLDLFETLSYIALVNLEKDTIMSVHGGIPRPNVENIDFYGYINSIKDLTDETLIDNLDRTMCQNIMWSDPYKGDEYRENVGRYHYKVEHLLNFMEKFKVDFLVRGHEPVEDGYRYDLDDNVITIFSSGIWDNNKEKTLNTDTAYTEVNPRVLKIKFTGERELI